MLKLNLEGRIFLEHDRYKISRKEKEMCREWQQTKYKEYVMPDAVYYQTLWAVRDLIRMEDRLKEIYVVKKYNADRVCETSKDYGDVRPTEKVAMERLVLEERIRAIRRALSEVPESCRPYILSNIILKNSGKNFADGTWKFWKQRFLFHVAHNLSLI